MKILSHRGYWKSPVEKNTQLAFERSFRLGFGTETDLRDHNGNIVISHDMPVGNEISFRDFLELVVEFNKPETPLTLALNIKADGLQEELISIMSRYPDISYFLFDMSVPDMKLYVESGLPVYTRISDVEKYGVYLGESEGIWLDNFSKEIWFDEKYLSNTLSKKSVCVVSSELHNNDPILLWKMLAPLSMNDNLILCTDRPEEASEFFGVY